MKDGDSSQCNHNDCFILVCCELDICRLTAVLMVQDAAVLGAIIIGMWAKIIYKVKATWHPAFIVL